MTEIIVRLDVEGTHRWEQAKEFLPQVGFLSNDHRHMFFVEARKEVKHDDRELEIILFKRALTTYLVNNYGDPCRFEKMSCEMIARELLEKFNCTQVIVLEDRENGACVTK